VHRNEGSIAPVAVGFVRSLAVPSHAAESLWSRELDTNACERVYLAVQAAGVQVEVYNDVTVSSLQGVPRTP